MHRMKTVRVSRKLLAGLVILPMVAQLGCVLGKEFRAVASPAIHTGVTDILTGVVDGVFAVIEPDDATGTEEADDTSSAP